jgi:hypothetical protein
MDIMKFNVHGGRMNGIGGAVALALAMCTGSALATPAMTSFNTGLVFPAYSLNETVGWQFSVATGAGVTVNSLGWWDQTLGTPLSSSHLVGIWNMSGQLLGSASVGTNDALNGAFRYTSLSSFVLAGGATYLIGGVDSTADGDTYTTSVTALVTDPLITFIGAARSNVNAGFAAPLAIAAGVQGRFGPNFDFTVNSVSAVPEPGALAMMLAGLGVVGAGRLRRRNSSAKV